MTSFEKITEMWSRAKQTIVAPQGFKDECEDYILGVMRDKLRADRFAICDDKYCTGVKAIVHEPMMCGKGCQPLSEIPRKSDGIYGDGETHDVGILTVPDTIYGGIGIRSPEFKPVESPASGGARGSRKRSDVCKNRQISVYGNALLVFEFGDGRSVTKHSLDDTAMHSLAKFMREYEVIAENLASREDETYGAIPVRQVLDLTIEPILDPLRGESYVDSDCVYQVDTDTLYQTSDDDIVRLFAMDFGKIADLANLVLQGNGAEEFFRATAEQYLRREIETDTNNDVYEFPCGNHRFEVYLEESPVPEKAVMVNVNVTNDKLLFAYGNGLVERIDEIDVRHLWDVVDCVEYRKHLHYEDVWGKARCVGMPESIDSNEFGKTAEEYIRYVVSDLRKSSRWFGFTRQRLMLMDKALTPFGFFRDIVCKNGKVEVEYFTCGEDDYFDLLFDAEPVEGCIKTCDFHRLSPVSMKHLVHLIGYGSGDDEDVREDYRHILYHEEWDDIVGVRAPYRVVGGRLVTTERIYDDAEMLELAKRKGVTHVMPDYSFWNRLSGGEALREI